MLTPQEQFREFIAKSQEILIILPPEWNGDFWGAGTGLYRILEKEGKHPTLVFSGEINPKFSFIEKPISFRHEISGARDFVLSFNTSRNHIDSVRWEQQGDNLNIFVTPERGAVNPQDFSFILAKFKFDLIITIGVPDLESLGDLYIKNTDLFFEVPVVNIDNKSENENFGQINLVDVTAAACSEIIFGLFDEKQRSQIDQKTAEALLSGLISGTDRFQKKNTSPRAFAVASELMNLGANQQEIIRWLYKTQPLPLLKLWGRAMAKINLDWELKLVWAELDIQDFVESRSNPDCLPEILLKLQENFTDGKIFAIAYNDTPGSTLIIIRSEKEILKTIQEALGGDDQEDNLKITLPEKDLARSIWIIREKLTKK